MGQDDAMPVDPAIAAILQMMNASGQPRMHEVDPEAARRMMRAITCDVVTPAQVVPVGSVEETTVPGAAGDLAARVYRPEGAGPWPTTLYLHGGGFVVGDLDTHDQVCRRLCRDAETVVVAPDYRLAPEHPFPAGLEDSIAVARWVTAHLDELGGDDRFAVGGDSAGGNFAAVLAQTMPDAVRVQLLLYPTTDVAGEHPSRVENGEGYFLDTATMEWFFRHYTTEVQGVDPEDPRLSPLRAPSLAGQPPAVVVTAEFDPLRDEGEAYADRLAEAGVPVEKLRFDGLIHGFLDMAAFSPTVESAVAETIGRFKKLLHG
jgi:acetyl esterase